MGSSMITTVSPQYGQVTSISLIVLGVAGVQIGHCHSSMAQVLVDTSSLPLLDVRVPIWTLIIWFIRCLRGRTFPVRKKAPTSRKSEAIATHAAPGVNGHGIHGIHRPQPNPQNFWFFRQFRGK